MAVTGWKLEEQERAALLKRFPPEWPDIVADHVTFDADAGPETPLPKHVSAQIVGCVSDGKGRQAMVVSIDGTTDRPDGSTYHITWSLDCARGRRAIESNVAIAQRGWLARREPISVRLIPARWASGVGMSQLTLDRDAVLHGLNAPDRDLHSDEPQKRD